MYRFWAPTHTRCPDGSRPPCRCSSSPRSLVRYPPPGPKVENSGSWRLGDPSAPRMGSIPAALSPPCGVEQTGGGQVSLLWPLAPDGMTTWKGLLRDPNRPEWRPRVADGPRSRWPPPLAVRWWPPAGDSRWWLGWWWCWLWRRWWWWWWWWLWWSRSLSPPPPSWWSWRSDSMNSWPGLT